MIPWLSAKEACQLALTHRLFVSGWQLNEHLHRGVKHGTGASGVRFAAVFMEGNTPLGVVVVTRFGDIQVFVRKSRRRERIGSKLINHVRDMLPANDIARMDAGTGLWVGSREFWKANNIPMYD